MVQHTTANNMNTADRILFNFISASSLSLAKEPNRLIGKAKNVSDHSPDDPYQKEYPSYCHPQGDFNNLHDCQSSSFIIFE